MYNYFREKYCIFTQLQRAWLILYWNKYKYVNHSILHSPGPNCYNSDFGRFIIGLFKEDYNEGELKIKGRLLVTCKKKNHGKVLLDKRFPKISKNIGSGFPWPLVEKSHFLGRVG